jgi:hypothetical protein
MPQKVEDAHGSRKFAVNPRSEDESGVRRSALEEGVCGNGYDAQVKSRAMRSKWSILRNKYFCN